MQFKFCPYCGTKLDIKAEFCNHCGHRQKMVSTQAVSSSNQPTNHFSDQNAQTNSLFQATDNDFSKKYRIQDPHISWSRAWHDYWNNYIQIQGYATRSQYWLAVLEVVICSILFGVFVNIVGSLMNMPLTTRQIISILIILAVTTAPNTTLIIRRFHDFGFIKPAWSIFLIIWSGLYVMLKLVRIFHLTSPGAFDSFFIFLAGVWFSIGIGVFIVSCLPSYRYKQK